MSITRYKDLISLSYCRDDRGILLGLEADQQLAVDVEHRPRDHRRLGNHQRRRLLPGEVFLVLVGQLAEGRASSVEQGLPAEPRNPAFQPLTLETGHPL